MSKKIDAARYKFGRRRLSQSSTTERRSFDWWLEKFKNDRLSFADIGKEAGFKPTSARESARQIFNKFFSKILPNRRNGRDRQRFRTLKSNETKLRDFSKIPPFLVRIVGAAQKASHKVCLVPVGTKVRGLDRIVSLNARVIVVNGRKVSVHHISSASRHLKRSYARVNLVRNQVVKYEFVVVCAEIFGYPERVFVFPTGLLLEGWQENRTNKIFHLPLENLEVYRNRFPKIDFLRYLNAWHLI